MAGCFSIMQCRSCTRLIKKKGELCLRCLRETKKWYGAPTPSEIAERASHIFPLYEPYQVEYYPKVVRGPRFRYREDEDVGSYRTIAMRTLEDQ